MSQLVRLTVFETKQFFKDKMGLFWTFLFPFVLLAVVLMFFGNTGGFSSSYSISTLYYCGDSVQYANIKKRVNESYSSAISLEKIDSYDAEQSKLYLIQPNQCKGAVDAMGEFYDGQSSYVLIVPEANQYSSIYIRDMVLVQTSNMAISKNVQLVDMTKELAKEEGDPLDPNYFLVSGIIAMTLVSISLFGITLWMVQMRSNKVFVKYKILPVTPIKLITSFVVSRAIFMCIYIIIFMAVCMMIFKLSVVAANLIYLILFSCFGVLTFISIGVCLSGLFKSSAAASGVVNTVYLVITFPSNLFIPDFLFPAFVSDIMGYLPVKAFVEGYRMLAFDYESEYGMLQGVLVLLVWLLISILTSVKTFRWNTDN